MAVKKFYLTSEGIQTCKRAWWQDPCSVHLHYPNIDAAKSAEEVSLAELAKKAKIEALKKGVRDASFTDSRVMHHFNFAKVEGTVRKYAEALDGLAPSSKWSKEMITSASSYWLRNGCPHPVEVRIFRKPKVDEDAVKIVGTWRITMDTTLGIALGREKVSKVLPLDFDSDDATEKSLTEAHEFFRKAVQLSGIGYFEDANVALAERMVQELNVMRDAVEGEYDGDFALWEQGRGCFADSGPSNIVVNVDYKKTTFRDKSVERFFRDCLYYAYSTPELEIKVTENNEKQGTSWSMERKADGEWTIRTVMHDGTAQISIAPTYDEIYSRVYWDFYEYVHINKFGESLENREEALKRAEYAKKLMIAVEEGIEENKKRVAENFEEERKNKEIRMKNYEQMSKPKRGF